MWALKSSSRCCTYLGINRLDVLILTHPHGDHVAGLSAVLRAQEIGTILDGTTLPYPSPAYTEFLGLVQSQTNSRISGPRAA